MKKILIASILSLSMLFTTSFAFAGVAPTEEKPDTQKVYVPVKQVDEVMDIDSSADVVGSSMATGEKMIKIETDEAKEIVEEVDGAKIVPKVKVYDADGYTNDYWNNPLNAPQLYNNGIFPLHKKGIKGKGIEIAVIDNDITSGLTEFSGRIDWANAYNAMKKKPLTADGKASDSHATTIADVLVSKPGNSKGNSGVAPEATVLPIQAFNGEDGDNQHILNALEYIKEMKDAGKLPNLRIVNMSFGFQAGMPNCQDINHIIDIYWLCEEIYDVIKYLRTKHKIVFVAAAGNEGGYAVDNDWLADNASFPADLPCVVSVAATDRYGQIAYFSNLSKRTHFAAVGEDMTLMNRNGKYEDQCGTSFAAPVVAGIMALFLSKDSTLTDSQMVSALKSTGTSIKYTKADKKERPKVHRSGKRAVNATRAYNKLFGTSYNIDVYYALKKGNRNFTNRVTSVEYTSGTFLGVWLYGATSIYGLSRSDFPSFKFSRTHTSTKTVYKIKVGGKGFVTRTATYSTKRIPKPKTVISAEKGKIKVKYKKVRNDSLRIKIYKNGKLYKKAYASNMSIADESESTKLPSKYKTRTIKVPKGKYTVKVENYEIACFGDWNMYPVGTYKRVKTVKVK